MQRANQDMIDRLKQDHPAEFQLGGDVFEYLQGVRPDLSPSLAISDTSIVSRELITSVNPDTPDLDRAIRAAHWGAVAVADEVLEQSEAAV